MILSIHHEGRVYRVECPDGSRVHRNPPDLEDSLVGPDPDHPDEPERHKYLLTPFAIRAAKRGDYGLKLIAEDEEGRDRAG